ncbi:N/A [soil metagenome]
MTIAGRQVLKSVAWSSGGALSMRLGQFLIGIVAARILLPHDFGVFAITLAVYAIVVNVSELGVSSALIRQNEDLDRMAPTAVTISLLSATSLAAILWFVAPLVARAFGAAEATDPVRVMAFVVLLAGPSAVPSALLTRSFRQDLRFRADALSFVVSNGLLIALALMGLGPLALAWSRVAGQLTSVITLIIVAPKYRPGFRRKEAAHLLRFGLPLVGANLTGFAIGSVDSIVIGHAAGPVKLGFYTLANNIASWPLGLSTSVLVNVGLPLMAKVKEDIAELSRYLTNALRTLSGVFFYITAMCIGLAQPLVDAVYGDKWAATGPVLAVLAAYGSVRVIMALLSDVLVACGATRSLFWIQVVWICVLIPSMIFGAHFAGIVGVASAQVLVGVVLVVPLTMLVANRVISVPVVPLLKALLWPLVAAAISGAVAHTVASFLANPWLSLLAGGIGGTLVYAALMVRWFRRLRGEIRGLYSGGTSAEVIEALSEADVHLDTPPALLDEAPIIAVPFAPTSPADGLAADPSDSALRPRSHPRHPGEHS